MARKKATTVTITPPEDDEEPTPEELVELNITEGGDLFRVTDELKATQGVRLMFVRTYPAGPDSAGYVGEMTPGEFTTDRVRELYGPGKYKVTIMGPKGILPGGGSIAIAKGVERPKDTTGIGSLAELMRTLEDRQAAQRAQDATRRDELLKLAIPGMFTLLASLVGGRQSTDIPALVAALKPAPGPSITDLTTALANIQQLHGGEKSQLSGIDGLLKMAELLEKYRGEGGGAGSTWVDVLRDVVKEAVPAVRPMLEQAAAAAAARAQPQLPAPAVAPAPVPIRVPMPAPAAASPPLPPKPTPAPPAPAAEPTLTEGADMWEMAKPIIRDQVNKLIGWAAAKGRVDLYAELFITELPQIVAKYVTPTQALAWLQHPDWWQVVKAHYPELEPHYAWLDQFRSELILLVEEQIPEGTDADAAG